MVVAWGDVRGQRPERVERCLETVGELLVHVLLDHLHRNMAGTFDHHLDVVPPRDLGEFPQGLQLAELGGVVGVRNGARAQTITEAERYVVGLHDLADVVEVRVEEVLFVMRQTPLGHDGATTRDDAGDTVCGQRHIAQQHARMDGEIVDALLSLFDQGVSEHLPGQILGLAVCLLQCLIDRHGADRHGRVAQDPLAGLMDVLAGRQVHQGVAAPARRPGHLLHLFLDRRSDRRVTDVGVDLHPEIRPMIIGSSSG